MKNEKTKKENKNRIKGFFADFKAFMNKGNVINLAIAFVMGAAFNAIVTSLVNDLIMPLVGLLIGKSDISEWVWVVNESLSFNYGKFIYAVVNFLIIAFTLFIIIKLISSAGDNLKKLAKNQQSEDIKMEEPTGTPTASEPVKETAEDILKDIRSLLRASEAAKTVYESEHSEKQPD